MAENEKVAISDLEKEVKLVKIFYSGVELNLVLVERNKKVLLDTGTSRLITKINERVGTPEFSIITHAHHDHAGGSGFLASKGSSTRANNLTSALLNSAIEAVRAFYPIRHRLYFDTKFSKDYEMGMLKDFGSPKILSTQLSDIARETNIVCHTASGHTSSSMVCEFEKILFTSDCVQGSGIKPSGGVFSIPQIWSFTEYLLTLQRIRSLKPRLIIPGHNFLPSSRRVIEGSEIDRFLGASEETAYKLLELGRNILTDGAVTLAELAQKLLTNYGTKTKLYPQALITSEAVLRYHKDKLACVNEGDIATYQIL